MPDSYNSKSARFIFNLVSLFHDPSRVILLFLSLIVVISSIFIRPIVIEGWETASFFLSYIFPFVVFFIFLSMAAMAKGELESESRTEDQITRIIDKYEGIVDGIGTALPLIGAGLILYFISQISPGHKSSAIPDPNQQRFLNIGAPFEVKSIFMLAAAKLFEPIFDGLARAGQGRNAEAGDSIQRILMDEELESKLNKINETANEIKSTMLVLENEKVMQSLSQLTELSRKFKEVSFKLKDE